MIESAWEPWALEQRAEAREQLRLWLVHYTRCDIHGDGWPCRSCSESLFQLLGDCAAYDLARLRVLDLLNDVRAADYSEHA